VTALEAASETPPKGHALTSAFGDESATIFADAIIK
jgi:hypothetical protein